jgi:hypothetical protein
MPAGRKVTAAIVPGGAELVGATVGAAVGIAVAIGIVLGVVLGGFVAGAGMGAGGALPLPPPPPLQLASPTMPQSKITRVRTAVPIKIIDSNIGPRLAFLIVRRK